MHRRGVSLVLSFVITANLMPVNLVQAYAEEVNTNTETISEEVEKTEEAIIQEEISEDDIKQEVEKNEVEEEKQEIKQETNITEEEKQEIKQETNITEEEKQEIKQETNVTNEATVNNVENTETTIIKEDRRDHTRKVTADIKVDNINYANIEGLDSDKETIVLNTNYTDVEDHYRNVFGKLLYINTTGVIDKETSDSTKTIKITPKSGYKVDFNLIPLLTQASVENGENNEKLLKIKPIDSTTWINGKLEHISGNINIKCSLKNEENREEIIIEKNGEGSIVSEKDNLYFHEENKTYIDKGSKHTFNLIPSEGKVLGSVTLDGEPVVVDRVNNKVTVGAGVLKVEFKDDVPIVETNDLNITLEGNGYIIINGEKLEEGKDIKLESGKEHRFTVKAEEGKFISSVKLGDTTLEAVNGVYTIPADFKGGNLSVVFSEKLETTIEVDELRQPYDGKEKIVGYKVKDSNGRIVKEGNIDFYKKNWLGQTVKFNPVDEGSYNFSISYDGNEQCKPTTYEKGVFEIYDAREEAIIEFGSTTSVYDNIEKELEYTVKGKNGEVLETGKAEFKKTILGIPVPYKPKDAGIYEYTATFKGNENYKSLTVSGDFEILKCKPKVSVGNTVAEYTGSSIKTNISVDYNCGYIALYTGVNYDLDGSVYIDLNLGDDEISKVIMGIINKIEIGNVADLKKALVEMESLLSGLGVDVSGIIKALNYLPTNLRVSLGAPKATGAYVATAIVIDKNAEVSVGVGSLLVHRKLSKVVFTEDSLEDKGIVKVNQEYNHRAVFEGSEDEAKLVYSGITSSGKSYHSINAPTQEGLYVVTAYSYDDFKYSFGLAMRSFTIVKEISHVSFSDDSLADKAVIKVGQNYTHKATIVETGKDAKILYTGVTLSGEKYKSTEKPVYAGVYVATAYDCGDEAYTAALAMRTFTIVREQNKVVFTEDSLSDKAVIKVGTTYNHEAIYKGTTNRAKVMYSGVDTDGRIYFSSKQPTKEGMYVATAYSYDDLQYKVGLAMRTFAISKFTTKTDIISTDKVYDGLAYKPTAIVKDKNGEIVENANVKYTYYSGKKKLESAPTEVGSYTVVATFMGDSAHIESMDISKFNIIKAEVTINIDDLEKVYGEDDPEEFTYSVEGLALDDTINVELVRSEGESVGTYDINIISTDLDLNNYNYSVNPGVFTINKAKLEVTIADTSKVYGEKDPEFEYTISGLVGDDNVDFELVREDGEEVGTYIITVVDQELKNYTYTVNEGTLTIEEDKTIHPDKPVYSHVSFSDDSLADKAVIKVGQNYTHKATIVETGKDAKIFYTGVTLSGEKYKSTEKPLYAGVYVATAYDCGDEAYTAALAMRTFTIVREQNKVVFTEDSLSDKAVIKVGTTYNHKAIYKGTTNRAKVMYSGVATNGRIYFSSKQPTKEGIYVATAYSYDDPKYKVGLAMRTFAISKFTTKTDIISTDKVYDGLAYKPTAIVKDKNGEIVENANVKYTYYSGKKKFESAPTEVGSYTVVATFMGDSAHIESMDISKFNIIKAEATININDLQKVYGEADPEEFTYSVEGLALDDTINVELVRSEGESVGTYDINIISTDLDLNNYNYSVNPGVFTINKAKLEVTIADTSKVYGEKDPEFEYTISGLVGDDNVDFELEREDGEEVGTYIVTVVDQELENYTYTVNEGTLTIEEDKTIDPDKPVYPDLPVYPDKPVNPENQDKPVNPENPDKPVNPENPDKPVNPENPDKPVNPENPDKPVNPENPDKPVNPENQDKPVNPENPDKPVNPENPDKPVNPENPDKPVNPENPDKPVNPENPDKPENQDKPVNPENLDKPVDPDKPVNPENPDKPVDPDKPADPQSPGRSGNSDDNSVDTDKSESTDKPVKPSKHNNSSENPKTSDVGIAGFAGMGIAALAGLFANRKKKRK